VLSLLTVASSAQAVSSADVLTVNNAAVASMRNSFLFIFIV
jgi:hypothetical protein